MRTAIFFLFLIFCETSFSQTPCENNFAGDYPCQNTHLLSHVSIADLNGGSNTELNDIWGWTDSNSGREFALVGMRTGTAFVEITDPLNPVVIGKLPTQTSNSTWRDIKVYNNFAFIGSEAANHGIQVFDLTQLLNSPSGYQTFSNSALYTALGDSHNIVINEESGYAYGVGANFSGGLHAIDISSPLTPTLAGGFSDDGYTHDAHVVNYIGPDQDYINAEIAFACNENTLTIVDVSDKTDMYEVSKKSYSDVKYTHQGWLTEDHKYFILGDELDELQAGLNTTTLIWDVQDLDNPVLIGTHVSDLSVIDHNQYVQDDWVYQSNYTAGLRILSLDNVAQGQLHEVAYFDTYDANNATNFNGTWSNYPFFQSRNVVISDITNGLFIVRPVIAEIETTSNPCPGLDISYALEVRKGLNGPIDISLSGLPVDATSELSIENPVEGEVSILTIGNISSVSPGNYIVDITFSDDIISHTEQFELNVLGNLQAPQNLSSEVLSNTVSLNWDPMPNSIACKIRGRIVGTNSFSSTPVFFGFEQSSYSVSLNLLQNNEVYEWQVVCGCSVSPIVASPWSAFDTFTVSSGGLAPTDYSGFSLLNSDLLIAYPNPSNGIVNFQLKNNKKIQSIEIFSSLGNIVLSDNQFVENSLEINIKHLTKGIYFARLSDGEQFYTKRVVIE